jgi:hypothetical protein
MEPTTPTPARPNRDAFQLAIVIGSLFLAFLIVLGIAAWNTRIAFLPLTPKAASTPAAAPAGAVLRNFGVSKQAGPAQLVGTPAPLGVAAPGFAPAHFAGFRLVCSGGGAVITAESDQGALYSARSCPAFLCDVESRKAGGSASA